MKKLIVNADDFGLHPLINQGIIKGHQEGFITSTSIMASAPAYFQAVQLAKANPRLGIGIHLTLVGGVKSILPKEKVSSLLNKQGVFFDNYIDFAKYFYSGRIKMSEIEAELRCQIEKVLSDNLQVTHIDSHQHIHILPFVNQLVIKLCNEYNINKMRIPKEAYFFQGGFSAGLGRRIGRAGLTFFAQMAQVSASEKKILYPDNFFGMLAGGNLNTALVGNILQKLPDGVSELMTHPGLDNHALSQNFSWQYHWQDELDAYLNQDNKNLLRKKEITLINFGGLD